MTKNQFITPEINPIDYWRAIVLYGANTATYKFALAQALLQNAQAGASTVNLDDVALPFQRAMIQHLKSGNKQITQSRSKFLKGCEAHIRDEISESQLIGITRREGFKYVLDKFHNLRGHSDLPPFFIKEKGQLVLTDNMLSLSDSGFFQGKPLWQECDERWKLVEKSWSFKMSPKNLMILPGHDLDFLDLELLGERVPLVSTRPALNGYQKGFCFYSFRSLSTAEQSLDLADVDHFFPLSLQVHAPFCNLNGVWNLVLADASLNRSKSRTIPPVKYVKRLFERNEYLIKSHDPLREIIISQTGKDERSRATFLNKVFSDLFKSYPVLMKEAEEVRGNPFPNPLI